MKKKYKRKFFKKSFFMDFAKGPSSLIPQQPFFRSIKALGEFLQINFWYFGIEDYEIWSGIEEFSLWNKKKVQDPTHSQSK